jgi:hypothetical protein
VASSHGDS